MSAIKKGDLVYVAKVVPCCGNTAYLGLHFTVGRMRFHEKGHCGCCYQILRNATTVEAPDGALLPVERLRKIDPPAEGEYDRVPVRKLAPRDESTDGARNKSRKVTT